MIFNDDRTNILVFAISVSVFCTVCFISVILNYKSTLEVDSTSFIPGRPLPSKYLVDKRLFSTVLNQGSRGTCWLFQVIAILEAEYKRQGMAKGVMKDDDYLRLSQESLGRIMIEKCQKYPSNPVCIDSPRSKNTSTSGSLEEIIQFSVQWPDILSSIVPESCCPYNSEPKDDGKCPADKYPQCLKKNPLQVSFHKAFLTQNARDAKQRLIDFGLPLGMGLTMPMQRYIYPCDNKLVSGESVCVHKNMRCPHDPTKFCCPWDYKMYKMSDVSFSFTTTGVTMPGTGHAVLLVGYNDALTVKREFNFSKQTDHIGGFIVRNSWGARGHSLEYLTGMITEDQEYRICPNRNDVTRWVPVTLECMKRTKDPTKCSTDMKLVRGEYIVNQGDVLVCKNETHCDVNQTYALLRESDDSPHPVIVWSDEGVPHGRVIKYGSGVDPEVLTLDTVPIHHMYYAFNLTVWPDNREGKCGFFFLPYETLDDLLRVAEGQYPGYWDVEGFTATWSKDSFSGGSGKDYSAIKESTEKISWESDRPISDLDL